jgi:hypothetical protein
MNGIKLSLVMNFGFAYDNLMDDCVSEDLEDKGKFAFLIARITYSYYV